MEERMKIYYKTGPCHKCTKVDPLWKSLNIYHAKGQFRKRQTQSDNILLLFFFFRKKGLTIMQLSPLHEISILFSGENKKNDI